MSNSQAPLNAFVRSPNGRVLVHPGHDQFAYSDGEEVENRIHEVLKGTMDLSVGSPELMAKIEDWPTEYHFTDTRANLLRHLSFKPGDRVLELGAGCGAITRFLGERGCAVVAVEGSLQRARCASERVRDLENVSVYCANFQDITFSGDYDFVTLIGVLEYSPVYFEGDDPMRACLEVARSAVAPGGTLIVAIENQLGLKYFAGATEDHLGTHFSGVEDRYLPNGVRTVGRQQIERALQASGFDDISFQYPFPDYKLPTAILFQEAFTRRDFRPSEIVRHLYARDYSGKDLRSIDASQVWAVLDDNGLLGHLSNSFLILAHEQSLSPEAHDAGGNGVLALAYSAGRAKRFQTQTTFAVGAGASIFCEKRLTYPVDSQLQPASPAISHRLVRDVYLKGSTLHSRITAALRSGDSQRVIALLRTWLDFLRKSAETELAGVWDAKLPGEFWDCTPANLIESDSGLRYFDAEWISEPGPNVANLVLRYLFGLAFSDASAPYFQACFNRTAALAVGQIIGELGQPLTDEILAAFVNEANEKNAVIFPLKPRIVLDPNDFLADRHGGVRPPGASSRSLAVRNAIAEVMRSVSRMVRR